MPFQARAHSSPSPARTRDALYLVAALAFTAGCFCLVQIVGSRNKAVLGPRAPLLHLTRYLGVPIRSELDRFSPYTRSVPLVGREHEMSELQRFLQDPRPILARVIVGAGGRGKTRLALERPSRFGDEGGTGGLPPSARKCSGRIWRCLVTTLHCS